MLYLSVKEALIKIFSNSENPNEVFKQVKDKDIHDLEIALRKISSKIYKQKLNKNSSKDFSISHNGQWQILEKPPVSEAQRKAMWAAASGNSNIGIPSNVGKDFANADQGGKLPKKKIEKAIKPGPTLNYGKIAPEQNPISNPAAAKAAKEAKEAKTNASTIDYSINNKAPIPKSYEGIAEKVKAMKAKIESENKESAIQTLARRQKMSKDESEPHKDDPNHEKKEKQKALKIKEEAQSILDMHKAEGSRSVFTMQHANDVLGMNHADGKTHLNNIVDNSSATDKNKTKIKTAINSSKSPTALAHMVSNHFLAAGGNGAKTGELKVIR